MTSFGVHAFGSSAGPLPPSFSSVSKEGDDERGKSNGSTLTPSVDPHQPVKGPGTCPGPRMLSLTLIPIHRQAKIGPTHPIAGTSSSSSQASHTAPTALSSSSLSPSEEGRGLRNSSRQFRSKSERMSPAIMHTQSCPVPKETKARLSVRLADDDILLPYHNRASEVKDLLYNNRRNAELVRSLEMLFSSSPEDWTRVRHLLCDVDRDRMSDRDWLEQLYKIIFPKSAASWCRLADCLGAHNIAWTKYASTPQNGEDYLWQGEEYRTSSRHARVFSSEDDEESVFESEPLSTSSFEFEALHELPETFKEAPIKMEKLSCRLRDLEGHHIEPDDMNNSDRHRSHSSLISSGEASYVHELLKSSSEGFAGVRLSCPMVGRKETDLRSEETRSRAVSAPSTLRGRRGSDVSRLHKFTHHRRLSNLFMSSITDENLSEREGSSKVPRLQWTPEPSPYSSGRDRNQDSSPSSSSFARSFAARARSVSSPQVTTINSPSAVSSKECTTGLLPDGRTRHPSAGHGPDSKEAAALLAFKNELKLSGYKDEKLESLKGGDDDDPPTRRTALSPSLSDDQDQSISTPATSPETNKRSLPKEITKTSGGRPELHRKRSAAIFAVPRSIDPSRSKYLLNLLEKEGNASAIEKIKGAIGTERYEKLCQVVKEKERDDLPDEQLLEHLGRNYFYLIDTQKDAKETIENALCDEGYEARWDAFVRLCQIWRVDETALREARRRSGPAVKLF